MASPAISLRSPEAEGARVIGSMLDAQDAREITLTAVNAQIDGLSETDLGSVWAYWNTGYVSVVTANGVGSVLNYSIPTTCSKIWAEWNTEYILTTSSVTISSSVIWKTWNGLWTSQRVWNEPSPEQVAAQEVILRAQYAEEKAARAAASVKARSLLLDNLDEVQRKQFDLGQTFEVHSKDGKRRYHVRYGTAGNVFLLDKNGKPTKRFCIHPGDGRIPIEDVMLVQKLMIEGAEDEFVRVANKTDVAA